MQKRIELNKPFWQRSRDSAPASFWTLVATAVVFTAPVMSACSSPACRFFELDVARHALPWLIGLVILAGMLHEPLHYLGFRICGRQATIRFRPPCTLSPGPPFGCTTALIVGLAPQAMTLVYVVGAAVVYRHGRHFEIVEALLVAAAISFFFGAGDYSILAWLIKKRGTTLAHEVAPPVLILITPD